jgi:DNA polymerase III alpha subunit
MQDQNVKPSNDDWDDAELRELVTAIVKCGPYLFRFARAFAYGMASYFLLWLQPYFTFSFSALALGIFFLATVRRTTFIAEAALAIIVLSVFIPPGMIQSLARLF